MIWDPEIVSNAIKSGFTSNTSQEISIAYWESSLGFAIGTNAQGELVVLGTQTGEATPVIGEFIKLELNKNLTTEFGTIERAFCLTFANLSDEHELATFAIANGLQELFVSCNGAVPIEAIRSLALNNFKLSTREIEIGLFGELIFLIAAGVPERYVLGWHENSHDPFDFKIGEDRYEVKTTTGPMRRHWFSLNQVVNNAEFNVKYVSVRTSTLIDQGSSCMDLIQDIRSSLAGVLLSRFNKQLEAYPCEQFISKFDRDQAIKSIKIFESNQLPVPSFSNGKVLSVKWLVEFPDLSG